MDLEFQESDIVFADDRGPLTSVQTDKYNHEDHHDCCSSGDILVPVHDNSPRIHINLKSNEKEVRPVSSFAPMVISGASILKNPDDLIEEEEEANLGMVPPHLIVGRRIAEKMASSACSRNGRILKGRYLQEFRNSILRMTGFLES